MDRNRENPAESRIEWQEAWAPAFHRVLLSIDAVEKLTRQASDHARKDGGADARL